MAIDTALKRASCLNVGSSTRVLPIPDGTIGQADRQMNTFNYSGILAGAVIVAAFRFTQSILTTVLENVLSNVLED